MNFWKFNVFFKCETTRASPWSLYFGTDISQRPLADKTHILAPNTILQNHLTKDLFQNLTVLKNSNFQILTYFSPFHSASFPQGFLIRTKGILSFLNPVSTVALTTLVTEYAWPLKDGKYFKISGHFDSLNTSPKVKWSRCKI